MGAERPFDEQPHRRGGLSLLAQPDPFAGELVGDGALGAFRHSPAIPERRGNRMGQCRHGARRGVGHRAPLGALFAFIGRRGRRGGQWLEPPPRVRWRRHERDGAHTGLAGCPQVRAVAVEAVRDNILERQYSRLVERLDHRGRQWGVALPHHLVWPLTFGPSLLVRVGEPRFRYKEPFVDQGITLPRGLGGKDAPLTMLHLAQRPAILAGHSDRVLAFFHEPRLIDNQHASRLAHLVLDQAMIRLPHSPFVPQRLTDEALHRPALAALHLQGHRCDRLAFKHAELAYHIVENLVPRLLPGKTGPKGRVEPTAFIHERLNIAPCQGKLGNRKRLPCRPTRREHPLPPGIVMSMEKEIPRERQSVNTKRRCRVIYADKAYNDYEIEDLLTILRTCVE